MTRSHCAGLRLSGVLGLALALATHDAAWASADSKARKELQSVAKRWCETIRASQVIPVYPLTEDLVPGDVFLVQTSIGDQATLYKRNGFLSLDDHRTRLKDLHYRRMYFDGYWKDEFGATPHPRPGRAGAGPIPTGGGVSLTEAIAPRAAFPSYSFTAKTSRGLGLALPIKSVPVALNYLGTATVTGSVLIADARTYAADPGELYQSLRAWTSLPEVRMTLGELMANRKGSAVFLRVVSRIYLTGGVIVSMNRTKAAGGGVEAGSAPRVSLVTSEGKLNDDYARILEELNKSTDSTQAITQAGAAFKFMSASESSVSMAETFDRPLAIGYLGFDVQVLPGGAIDVPIPTFDHLERRVTAAVPNAVGPLTVEQARFKFDLAALESLVISNPDKTMTIIAKTVAVLPEHDFDEARALLKKRTSPSAEACDRPTPEEVVRAFRDGASTYASAEGAAGINYARLAEAIARSWD